MYIRRQRQKENTEMKMFMYMREVNKKKTLSFKICGNIIVFTVLNSNFYLFNLKMWSEASWIKD